ncbi:MAG TPA: translation elongation factor Ts [Candidatus Colwellbacteria bacterium]|jgi:elongation factor Ts|nr:translation elongation factor Ts [Candidatus Colwellbacteria bacterium]
MNAETVKRLREETGAGVMDTKRALEDAAGDFEKAKALIAERGLAKAEKKAERQTGSGRIFSYIHNERIGVLLLLRCETDFVARLEDFQELGRNLAMQIAAMEPETTGDLLAAPYIRDENTTIDNLIKGVVAKTGENIQVEKFCRYVL